MDVRVGRCDRLMWNCPQCGRQFANRNQWHACGPYSVESFLEGQSPEAIRLFNSFVELATSCGPVTLAPAKTRIGFQARTIFASVNRLSKGSLAAHVVLARRLDNPRFSRIESLSPTSHAHHFQINDLDELDDEVRGWLCEAHSLGAK
jgi:hypothetical protein